MFGSIIWTCTLSISGLPTLFAAQFLLGLGTGNLGVTRSYVVEQSTPEQRTYRLSWLSSLQYAGFTVTPLLGSALVVAGRSISPTWEYQLAPLALCFFALMCMALLVYPFEDIAEVAVPPKPSVEIELTVRNPIQQQTVESKHADDVEKVVAKSEPSASESTSTSVVSASADPDGNSTPPNTASLSEETQGVLDTLKSQVFYLLLMLNFSTRGVISIYESLISVILLNDYGLSNVSLGLVVSGAGLVGTLQLIFFKQTWSKYFSDYTLMVMGLLVIIVSQTFVINWGPTASKYPLWTFVLATYCMYGFGYPVTNSAVLGCFSKLRKNGRQSRVLSLFTSMSSLARAIMPIVSSQVQSVENSAPFSIVAILASWSLLGVFLYADVIRYYAGSTGTAHEADKASSALSASDSATADHSSKESKESFDKKRAAEAQAVCDGGNVVRGLSVSQYIAVAVCALLFIIYVANLAGWGN